MSKKPTKWRQSHLGPVQSIRLPYGETGTCQADVLSYGPTTSMYGKHEWSASVWASSFSQRAQAFEKGVAKSKGAAKIAAKKALAKMCNRPVADFDGYRKKK